MAENEETPEPDVTVPYGHELSTFANGLRVRKPGEVVYVDFLQSDTWDDPPEHAEIVGRFVITPELARRLRDGLTELLSADA